MSKNHIIILVIALVILAVQGAVLYWLGNPFMCPCGNIQIWDGAVRGVQDSQHIFDWYSFSHVVYGIVLYFFLWLARKKFPRVTIATAFIIVVMISAGWEVFENTQFAVRHFQANTISYEYRGDSVVNSLMDTVTLAAGFWAAFFLPVWLIVIIAIALEVLMAIYIRDNSVLGMIMFARPMPALFHWQAALSP